jgi:hypothetical protein
MKALAAAVRVGGFRHSTSRWRASWSACTALGQFFDEASGQSDASAAAVETWVAGIAKFNFR